MAAIRLFEKLRKLLDVVWGTPADGQVLTYDADQQKAKWATGVGAKADKVGSATAGNFAGLDAGGNLTDSGHAHADYAAAGHAHTALDHLTIQNADLGSNTLEVNFPLGQTAIPLRVQRVEDLGGGGFGYLTYFAVQTDGSVFVGGNQYTVGSVGIGAVWDTNYKLKVTGNAWITGTLNVVGALTNNGTAVSLAGHAHAIADTTGLQDALDGKSATGHNHDLAYAPLFSASVITDATAADIDPLTYGAWNDVALSVDLPEAGTYLVIANVRYMISAGGGGYIEGRLRNSTDDVVVLGAIMMCHSTIANTVQQTSALCAVVTVAGAKTIKAEVYPVSSGGGVLKFYNQSNGIAQIQAFRLK